MEGKLAPKSLLADGICVLSPRQRCSIRSALPLLPPSTWKMESVLLKIRLHSDGCADRIRRRIGKIEESIDTRKAIRLGVVSPYKGQVRPSRRSLASRCTRCTMGRSR